MSKQPAQLISHERDRSGFTMLLTIMVLALLITVIVLFQSDMFLHARASQFRLAKVQCRYAAESGLVMAYKMVEQALDAQREGDFKAITSIMKEPEKEDPNQPADDQKMDPNSPDQSDPNLPLSPTDDPIATLDWLDPNKLSELLESGDLLDAVPLENPLIINKKILELGKTRVEIEVYDENAKLPLHWNIDSPYMSGSDRDKDVVLNLGVILGVESETTKAARDLIQSFGRQIQARGIRKVIEVRKGSGVDFRGRSTLTPEQLTQQPMIWEQQRLRLSYNKAREMEFQQKEAMAIITARLNYEITQNEQLSAMLKEPLANGQGTFLDYVGAWGHDRININTAPEEVLHAAFKIMGFDQSMAQSVISRREQKPYASTYELKDTPGIGEGPLGGLLTLTTVRSDTFSIQIRARQGACITRLVAGVYRNRLGQLQTIAVFQPKGY